VVIRPSPVAPDVRCILGCLHASIEELMATLWAPPDEDNKFMAFIVYSPILSRHEAAHHPQHHGHPAGPAAA
jgi:hypothetical protein